MHRSGCSAQRIFAKQGGLCVSGWVLELYGITSLHLAAALPQGTFNITGKDKSSVTPATPCKQQEHFPMRGSSLELILSSLQVTHFNNKETALFRYTCVLFRCWLRLFLVPLLCLRCAVSRLRSRSCIGVGSSPAGEPQLTGRLSEHWHRIMGFAIGNHFF